MNKSILALLAIIVMNMQPLTGMIEQFTKKCKYMRSLSMQQMLSHQEPIQFDTNKHIPLSAPRKQLFGDYGNGYKKFVDAAKTLAYRPLFFIATRYRIWVNNTNKQTPDTELNPAGAIQLQEANTVPNTSAEQTATKNTQSVMSESAKATIIHQSTPVVQTTPNTQTDQVTINENNVQTIPSLHTVLDKQQSINWAKLLSGKSHQYNHATFKALLEQKNKLGKTVLIRIAQIGNRHATIKALLHYMNQVKADINAVDNQNRSALYYAFENNDTQSIAFLIQYGANLRSQYKDGKTFFAFAKDLPSSHMIYRATIKSIDAMPYDSQDKQWLLGRLGKAETKDGWVHI